MEIFIPENFQNECMIQYLFAEETGAIIQFHNEFEDQALDFLKQTNIQYRKCATQKSDAKISVSLNTKI